MYLSGWSTPAMTPSEWIISLETCLFIPPLSYKLLCCLSYAMLHQTQFWSRFSTEQRSARLLWTKCQSFNELINYAQNSTYNHFVSEGAQLVTKQTVLLFQWLYNLIPSLKFHKGKSKLAPGMCNKVLNAVSFGGSKCITEIMIPSKNTQSSFPVFKMQVNLSY